MANNTFTCDSCNKTYRVEGELPDVPEGSTLVCGACNDKLKAAMNTFLKTQKEEAPSA